MKVVLSDGTSFIGKSFGASRDVGGEVVFNTGPTGYVEALTDPSYHGQILVLTYPLQGNYGVPEGPFESAQIQCSGLVVHRYTPRPSHHASVRTLGDWLCQSNVPAIEGIDTRVLTRRLRERGTMQGWLVSNDDARGEAESIDMVTVARRVVPNDIVSYQGGDGRVLVIDTGIKDSILRALRRRGLSVVRAPFHASWEPLVDEVDGVLIGNGPGDPMSLAPLVARIRSVVLSRNVPTFGICLGHQLLSLAAGARTYKLPYGHRSQNQPVQDVFTQRAYVTSQNHGYAVDAKTVPSDWEPWFVNLNDGTNEGVRHRTRPFMSVQFHPEGAPGPRDTAYLFDDFTRLVMQSRRRVPFDVERPTKGA
jgi:carbamoyl-phosphate synthase small subunit